jgi:hypothetical protein
MLYYYSITLKSVIFALLCRFVSIFITNCRSSVTQVGQNFKRSPGSGQAVDSLWPSIFVQDCQFVHEEEYGA